MTTDDALDARHVEDVRSRARADAAAIMATADTDCDAVVVVALPSELLGLLHDLAEQQDRTVDELVVRALRDLVAREAVAADDLPADGPAPGG